MKSLIKKYIASIKKLDTRQTEKICAENSGIELLLKLSDLYDKISYRELKKFEDSYNWITGHEISDSEYSNMGCLSFDITNRKCIKNPDNIKDCENKCKSFDSIDNLIKE